MSDPVWQILMIDGLVGWLIYIGVILPKVREERIRSLRDKGAGTGNPIKALMEYKKLCEKNNESTFWFQVQICLVFVFVLFCFLGIMGQ